MIKNIKIGNFKCIRDLEIELAPLTIFVGPNASGKSSILEAMALMTQCIDGYKSVVRSIKGELVDFEDKRGVFCKGSDKEWLSLGFGVGDVKIEDLGDSVAEDFQYFSKKKIPVLREYITFLKKLKGLSSKQTIGIEYIHRIRGDSDFENSYTIEGTRMTQKREKDKVKSFPPEMDFEVPVAERMSFLPPLNVRGYHSEFFNVISDVLRNKIENVYFLSAERGFIPWTYKSMGEEITWVGKKGEDTLVILARLMKPECDEKRLPYELFFQNFGTKYVWAGWDHFNVLASDYKDPFLESSHKFPSLGYGSKQLLSVITQLAYSDRGSIILVEEPEMSLHPGYQRLLPALFGRAVNEGKQILITSHSSYFPLSLELVLRGYELRGQTTRGMRKYKIKLSVDDMAVYHVKRDKKGYTKAERLEIDENGLREGIPSFIEVEREILGRFISRE